MKFVMLMYICSHIAGNECKVMPTPIVNFNTYSECAIYGYEYSTILLKEFNEELLIRIKHILYLIVENQHKHEMASIIIITYN